MAGLNGNGAVPILVGTVAMGSDPDNPAILYCGKVERDLGADVLLSVEWSNAPRRLIGIVRQVPKMFLYAPEAFQAVMAQEEYAQAQHDYDRQRLEAVLTLFGLWAIQTPGDPRVAELRFALQMTAEEVARSLYSAYVERDAKENGSEPFPIRFPEAQGDPEWFERTHFETASPDGFGWHRKDEHELHGACRYCSGTLAAIYRAGEGRVVGLRRREEAPGPESPPDEPDAPQEATGA